MLHAHRSLPVRLPFAARMPFNGVVAVQSNGGCSPTTPRRIKRAEPQRGTKQHDCRDKVGPPTGSGRNLGGFSVRCQGPCNVPSVRRRRFSPPARRRTAAFISSAQPSRLPHRPPAARHHARAPRQAHLHGGPVRARVRRQDLRVPVARPRDGHRVQRQRRPVRHGRLPRAVDGRGRRPGHRPRRRAQRRAGALGRQADVGARLRREGRQVLLLLPRAGQGR